MKNGKEEPYNDNPTNIAKIEVAERENETVFPHFYREYGGQDYNGKCGRIFASIDEVFDISSVIETA